MSNGLARHRATIGRGCRGYHCVQTLISILETKVQLVAKRKRRVRGTGTLYQRLSGRDKGKWFLTIPATNPDTDEQFTKTFVGGTAKEEPRRHRCGSPRQVAVSLRRKAQLARPLTPTLIGWH